MTGGSIDEIDLSHSEMRGFKGTDSAFVSEWLVQPGLQKLFTIYKGIKEALLGGGVPVSPV